MTSEAVAILNAVLVFLGTLIGALLSSSKTQAVMKTKFEDSEKRSDEKFAEVKEQINKLETKQDKHNNFMERLIVVEGNVRELQNDVNELKKGA